MNMNYMGRLEVLDVKNRWELTRTILSSFIEKYFSGKKNTIKILEAGCGQAWNLNLSGIDYVLTGLDISKETLEIRKYRQQDLDEIIIGDLRTIELNNAEYDVIYCSYVLEHIKEAQEVLDRFFRWLKPRGLLVLLIPDRNTVFGFITKFSPFWFHVLYYRYILKDPNAGKPSHGPFPVYYHKVVSRQGIHDYCHRRGYKIHVEYGTNIDISRTFGGLSRLAHTLLKSFEIISFRKFASTHNVLIYVVEKPQYSE